MKRHGAPPARVLAIAALVALLLAVLLADAAGAATHRRRVHPKKRSTHSAAPAPKSASPRASAHRAAPMAAAAASDPDVEWKKARALGDQRRYDEALGVVARALEQHPDDTGLRWLEAGLLGEAGRNRESVAHYERLVSDHPDLAARVRTDLAAQRLWSDDPGGALRDLNQRLAEDPSDREALRLRALTLSHLDRLTESLGAYDSLLATDPGDTESELGRARVLTWMGRHRQAGAAYERYLSRHPDDFTARLAMAQNLNWGGEHRRAAATYREMQSEGRTDPEILKGLAYAEYWAGRPDAAREALDSYVARAPDDPEGRKLALLLAGEQSPSLTVGYGRSDDTDGLRVQTTMAEYRHPFDTRTTLELAWRQDNASDAGGEQQPNQLSAQIGHHFSVVWSAEARAGVLIPGGDGASVGVGEANLTARPDDRWRFDAGWARDPVLTRLSLALGIMLQTVTLGVDGQLGTRVAIHVDQRVRYYSDDNQAALRTASIRTVVESSPRSELGLSIAVERLTTDQDLDHGYYDPSQYTEAGPGADLTWRPQEGWTLSLNGKLGQQHEEGSHAQAFHAVTASVEMPLGSQIGLRVEGSRSNSNLSSATGFRQRRWSAALTRGF